VISLGISLGKTVVAEGVENQAQFDFLNREGCHEFQGYLIAKPMAEAMLTGFLRGGRALLVGQPVPDSGTS
jgi:EAL domain-containing protein (putative c-di-GMP-specific phosphodiesterase class I)